MRDDEVESPLKHGCVADAGDAVEGVVCERFAEGPDYAAGEEEEVAWVLGSVVCSSIVLCHDCIASSVRHSSFIPRPSSPSSGPETSHTTPKTEDQNPNQ